MTSKLFRGLAVLGMVAGLGACNTVTPGADEHARLSTERFKVTPVQQPEEVLLALHASGISQQQASALAGLVAKWRDEEAGVIGVQAPSDAAGSGAAYRMAESARAFLLSQGVPPDQIELMGYDPKGEASPPLKVGYMHYQVEIPKCGQAWTNITSSFDNDVQPNFGCAVTANIAAQVANPADLAGPRAATPQDATRRQVVLDKYRKGEVTSAAKDEQASGAVSRAIQ
jgi:pilus assembly protein CpaD